MNKSNSFLLLLIIIIAFAMFQLYGKVNNLQTIIEDQGNLYRRVSELELAHLKIYKELHPESNLDYAIQQIESRLSLLDALER